MKIIKQLEDNGYKIIYAEYTDEEKAQSAINQEAQPESPASDT